MPYEEKPGKPRDRLADRRQAIKCKAHIERGPRKGEPCPRYALTGQLVCRQHGGMAPQNLAKAQVTIAEDKAMRGFARLDLEPVANALEALQKHAAIVIAWRDKCAEMLNVLDPQGLRYEGRLAGEQVRGEVGMWERALDRATATLSALARCQVDERITTIRERDAQIIAAAMAAALLEADCGGDMAELVRIGFARRLHQITSGRQRIA